MGLVWQRFKVLQCTVRSKPLTRFSVSVIETRAAAQTDNSDMDGETGGETDEKKHTDMKGITKQR